MPPVFKIEDSLEERSTAAFPPPLNIAPLPPMIVTEKGESLDEFCARRYPDPFTVVQARLLQLISPLVDQLCCLRHCASAVHASDAAVCSAFAALWPLCRCLSALFVHCARTIRLSWAYCVQLLVHVANKLQDLHSIGWVHRDLKVRSAFYYLQ